MRQITIYSSPIPLLFRLLLWIFLLNVALFTLIWLDFVDNLQFRIIDILIFVFFFYVIFFFIFLYIWSTGKYIIDETKISVSRGIIFKKNISIRLDDIETIDTEAGFINRIFGYGDVTIKTGGGREAQIYNLSNPQEIHDLIEFIRAK